PVAMIIIASSMGVFLKECCASLFISAVYIGNLHLIMTLSGNELVPNRNKQEKEWIGYKAQKLTFAWWKKAALMAPH
ncbi:hypothetical protein JTI73_17545, partial [Vibrio furnissii]